MNLGRALTVAKHDEDIYFEMEGMMSVVQAWLEIGEVERALRLVLDTTVSYVRARATALVARYLCDSGNTQRAIREAQEIPDVGIRTNTLCSVAVRYAQEGHVDAGGSVLNLVEYPQNIVATWIEIGHALADASAKDLALKSATAASAQIDDAKKRSELLWRSVILRATFQHFSKVDQTMNELWWAIEGRGDTLRKAAEALAQRGLFQEALSVADRIYGRGQGGRARGLALACIARAVKRACVSAQPVVRMEPTG